MVRLEILVVKELKTTVWHECFWNAYAFRRLVVLHQRCHDARQGEGRSIERVAQLNLLVFCTAVAAFQTVGLITLEVGGGAHFEPALLSGRPYLKVVADGAGEGHVTTAEAQDAVGEFQFLEQTLHVGEHLVQ